LNDSDASNLESTQKLPKSKETVASDATARAGILPPISYPALDVLAVPSLEIVLLLLPPLEDDEEKSQLNADPAPGPHTAVCWQYEVQLADEMIVVSSSERQSHRHEPDCPLGHMMESSWGWGGVHPNLTLFVTLSASQTSPQCDSQSSKPLKALRMMVSLGPQNAELPEPPSS